MTNQEETPRHSVSVAGVIVDDTGEHVLLIQRRDNGHWEPPGGVLELDETIEEGLRREIREETGVEVTIERLTGVYKNMSRGIVALVYRCRAISQPAGSSAEASSVRWHPLAALGGMESVYQVRVRDAVSPMSSVPTRTHNGVHLLPKVPRRNTKRLPPP